jgi:hypothetical protein
MTVRLRGRDGDCFCNEETKPNQQGKAHTVRWLNLLFRLPVVERAGACNVNRFCLDYVLTHQQVDRRRVQSESLAACARYH